MFVTVFKTAYDLPDVSIPNTVALIVEF